MLCYRLLSKWLITLFPLNSGSSYDVRNCYTAYVNIDDKLVLFQHTLDYL